VKWSWVVVLTAVALLVPVACARNGWEARAPQNLVDALGLPFQVVLPGSLPHGMYLTRLQSEPGQVVIDGGGARKSDRNLVTLTFGNGMHEGPGAAWFWLYQSPPGAVEGERSDANTMVWGVRVTVLGDPPNRLSAWWKAEDLNFHLRTLTDGALTREDVLDIIASTIDPNRRLLMVPDTVSRALGVPFSVAVPSSLPKRVELQEVNVFPASRWPQPVPQFSPGFWGPVGFSDAVQREQTLVRLAFVEATTVRVEGNLSRRQDGRFWLELYESAGRSSGAPGAEPIKIAEVPVFFSSESRATRLTPLWSLAWTKGGLGFYVLAHPTLFTKEELLAVAAATLGQ